MVWCGCNADVGFYEDSAGIAYIGSQKSGYELMHRIPQSLLDAVWTQRSVDGVPAGATLDVAINSTASAYRVAPISPSLNHNGGLSISVWLRPTFGANVADASSVQVGSSLTASCDAGSFVLTTFESSVEFNFTIGGERTTIVPTGMCVDELLVTTMSRGPTHVGIGYSVRTATHRYTRWVVVALDGTPSWMDVIGEELYEEVSFVQRLSILEETAPVGLWSWLDLCCTGGQRRHGR